MSRVGIPFSIPFEYKDKDVPSFCAVELLHQLDAFTRCWPDSCGLERTLGLLGSSLVRPWNLLRASLALPSETIRI